MARFVASKTFDHSEGLTCCYRGHRSETKSRFLHGTKLHIRMVFEVLVLDDDNRTIDSIDFDPIKAWLHEMFDHTTCVAEDDPAIGIFMNLHSKKAIDLRIMPGVGPEKFSEMIWHRITGWLRETGLSDRMLIRTVEVKEQESFSAMYLA